MAVNGVVSTFPGGFVRDFELGNRDICSVQIDGWHSRISSLPYLVSGRGGGGGGGSGKGAFMSYHSSLPRLLPRLIMRSRNECMTFSMLVCLVGRVLGRKF